MNFTKAPDSAHHFSSSALQAAMSGQAVIMALLASIAINARAQADFTKITSGPIASDNPQTSISAVWVDFDGDGDLDLSVTANQLAGNLLYRNEGGGNFTKISQSAIVNTGEGSRGLGWADLDNDGRLDLVIGRSIGPALVFLQRSDGTFARSSLNMGVSSGGGGLADYDGDGVIDLAMANDGLNALWHNNGQGGLSAVAGTGIDGSGTRAEWADLDNDGDLDLLVTESAVTGGGPSRLYRNEGGARFTRITSGPLVQKSTDATGAWFGDYDNDGLLDVFVTRRDATSGRPLPSFLFHNNDNGNFTQVEQSPFTSDTGAGFNGAWADYDNDGWLDLFVTDFDGGGNRLYNNNGDGTFTRVLSGPVVMETAHCANATWGDYDRNGFLDLFVCNLGTGNFLYHNEGNANSWINVKCIGTRSNRSAIGAKVRVQAAIGGRTFWQLREIGGAYNPLEAHFGLGNATNVQTLRIEWPSGTVQELHNVPAKQFLTIAEPACLTASASQDAVQLTLNGGRNLQYELQVSSDLNVWVSLGAITITNLNGTTPIAAPNSPSLQRGFYRALLEP